MMRKTILLLLLLPAICFSDDWPQWRGPNRDGTWKETGLIEKFPQKQIKLLWRTPISGGYSGPTVANGRVYVTDRVESKETERVHCLDAKTGKQIWLDEYACDYARVRYSAGPRAAVLINDGRSYSLGSTGHLRCQDAATGKLLWKKEPGTDYEIGKIIWGIASAPLVEKDLLIVQLGARPDACIVALEPATGKVLWKYPTPPNKMVINVPTPVVEQDRIFLTCFYDGAYMLEMKHNPPSVEKIWRREGRNERNTDALHSMIVTPIMADGYIYGVDSYGEFRCLESATGDRVWEDHSLVPGDRWANIHMVRNGDKVWMFNERGELIITKLSPNGVEEISRAKLIEPTTGQLNKRGGVCWSHPAYANKCVFARNDNEIVCASLAK